MVFCRKCETNVDEGLKFCPNCGNALTPDSSPEQQTPPAQETAANKKEFSAKVTALNNTADTTSDYDANDIAQNKGISVLSYFGPLVFIPMFVKKDSKFSRFHVNQGLTLFILDVAYGIIQLILTLILRAIFPWSWEYGWLGGRGFVYDVLTTVLGLVWIIFTVLAIIGLINVLNGKAKELPVIGKFKFLK